MANNQESEKPYTPPPSVKPEAEAISAITEALLPLDQEARNRVVQFVGQYFRLFPGWR